MTDEQHNMLKDLDNNESILLLYLAGELTPQERTEIEQRLAGDASMRADLERVRDAYASAQHAMERLDELTSPPIPDSVALRQVTRLVKHWQADQLEQARNSAIAAQERTLRFPWWTYPVATAAAVVLALLVWWVNLDNIGLRDSQTYMSGSGGGWGAGVGRFGGGGFDNFGMMMASTADEPSPLEDFWVENLTQSFDNGDELLNGVLLGDPLEDAEHDVIALSDRRSDFPDALFMPPETENP